MLEDSAFENEVKAKALHNPIFRIIASHNHITPLGFAFSAPAFVRNTVLTQVDLSSNPIGHLGAIIVERINAARADLRKPPIDFVLVDTEIPNQNREAKFNLTQSVLHWIFDETGVSGDDLVWQHRVSASPLFLSIAVSKELARLMGPEFYDPATASRQAMPAELETWWAGYRQSLAEIDRVRTQLITAYGTYTEDGPDPLYSRRESPVEATNSRFQQ